MADEGNKGFSWRDGLLFRKVTDPLFQSVHLLVLPEQFRMQVLKFAHDASGHLGHRKVLCLLRQRFDWPLMTKEVTNYCMTCEVCQRCSRAAVRKAPMVARPVLTEPFESVAIDIVGPLPKAKGDTGGC